MPHITPLMPLGGALSGTLPNPTLVADEAGLAIAQQVFGQRWRRPFDPRAGANITITPDAMGVSIAGIAGGGSSLEIKEVDGIPDVTGVTQIIVSNGTLSNNTGGSVSIVTGGGGTPITARFTSDIYINPDPTGYTAIAGLSVTVSPTVTTFYEIRLFIIKVSSHSDRYTVYEGSNQIAPANLTPNGFYDYPTAEGSNYQLSVMFTTTLSPGTHVITVKNQASLSTSAITFKEGYLSVMPVT